MNKSLLIKKVSEISEGVLASLTDLILTYLFFGYESVIDPRVGHSYFYALKKVDKRLEEINYGSLKRAFRHAVEKGWIKEDLKVTPVGQKRIKDIFSPPVYSDNWNSKWYLVSFDIPEKLRLKRNILRENLEKLNFGKLQNSVWISPYNFLGDVKEIVDSLDIKPYVIFSISDKVGEEESKILAERIWGISGLQEEYQDFIAQIEERKKKSHFNVIFNYQSIAIKDPDLPRELLPEDWLGGKAKRLYLSFLKTKALS